jgi:hypothetical protein
MKDAHRNDNNFVDAAVDDTRRRAKIQELAKQRQKLIWGAGVVTVCALGTAFIDGFGKSNNAAGCALILFVATMNWILLFKCESELRLLKLVDKLKSSIR